MNLRKFNEGKTFEIGMRNETDFYLKNRKERNFKLGKLRIPRTLMWKFLTLRRLMDVSGRFTEEFLTGGDSCLDISKYFI